MSSELGSNVAHEWARDGSSSEPDVGDGDAAEYCSSLTASIHTAADAYRQVVTSLRASLDADDIAAARPWLRQLIGPITVVPTTQDGERFLTANFPAVAANSARTAGEGRLVAGAGSQLFLALITALDILSSLPRSKTVSALPAAP